MAKNYKVIRLDVMSGNKDNTQVKSAKYFDATDVSVEVQNGTIVAIGGLLDGEREIHKVTDVEADSTYVGIITTPEVMYDERLSALDDFINEANTPVRVHVLHAGDMFSIANGSDTADIALGANLVAKYQGEEVAGRYTYRVFEVQAV